MSLNYHFGESLTAYLNKKRLTKLWLSQQLGVSHQSVDTYCNTRSPRQRTIDKILSVLNITLDELYTYSSEETLVKEDEVKYSKEPTVNISMEQFQYFLEAVQERDALKQKEIEKLQEQNQGVSTNHKIITRKTPYTHCIRGFSGFIPFQFRSNVSASVSADAVTL